MPLGPCSMFHVLNKICTPRCQFSRRDAPSGLVVVATYYEKHPSPHSSWQKIPGFWQWWWWCVLFSRLVCWPTIPLFRCLTSQACIIIHCIWGRAILKARFPENAGMQFLCLRFRRLVVKKILDPGPIKCWTCHTWAHEKLAQHLIPGKNSCCVNDMPIEFNHVLCKLNHIPSPLGSSIHVF